MSKFNTFLLCMIFFITTQTANAIQWDRVSIPANIELTSDTVIQAEQVELLGDIYTHGHGLRINTRTLKVAGSEGQKVTIRTYKNDIPRAPSGIDGQNATVDQNATSGTNAVDGQNGRTPTPIIIYAEYIKGSPFEIFSFGETGQAGGLNGVGGAELPRCSDHIFPLGGITGIDQAADCTKCKGGKLGGENGVSGNGGKGGDAGIVQVITGCPCNDAQLQTSTVPGQGGANGDCRRRYYAGRVDPFFSGYSMPGMMPFESLKFTFKKGVDAAYDNVKSNFMKAWLDWNLIRSHDAAISDTLTSFGIAEKTQSEVLKTLAALQLAGEDYVKAWREAHPHINIEYVSRVIDKWEGVSKGLGDSQLQIREKLTDAISKLVVLLDKYKCGLYPESEKPKKCATLPGISESFEQVGTVYTETRKLLLNEAISLCRTANDWLTKIRDQLGKDVSPPTFLIVPICQDMNVVQQLADNPYTAVISLVPDYAYIPINGLSSTKVEMTEQEIWVTENPVKGKSGVPFQGVVGSDDPLLLGKFEKRVESHVVSSPTQVSVISVPRDLSLTIASESAKDADALTQRIHNLTQFHSGVPE